MCSEGLTWLVGQVAPWVREAADGLRNLQCFDAPSVGKWPGYKNISSLDICKPENALWDVITELSACLTQAKIGKHESLYDLHRLQLAAGGALQTLEARDEMVHNLYL